MKDHGAQADRENGARRRKKLECRVFSVVRCHAKRKRRENERKEKMKEKRQKREKEKRE